MRFLKIVLCVGLCMTLTGCGAEKEIQAKMTRGCEAAVKTMLNKPDYERQIESVTGSKLGMSDGFRLVTIDVVTKTKEFNDPVDESFSCKFEETKVLGFIGWKAALVQIKIDDVIYGSDGGELFGTVEDQMALTAAVEAAMK
jgi:hypothetical protein